MIGEELREAEMGSEPFTANVADAVADAIVDDLELPPADEEEPVDAVSVPDPDPVRSANPTAGGLYRYTEYVFFSAASPTIH